MSALTAATVAALLVANPSATDADRLAANGGFLLGNAHRCGIAGDRIVEAGQLVRDLIAATAEDAHAQEEATSRLARFFLVTAVLEDSSTPPKSQPVASCQKVAKEFERLERHLAAGREAAATVSGGTAGMHFRLSDGE